MKWVTRERPKIDRIACPWLILRFIDAEAEFLYVPADEVLTVAAAAAAAPYDIPGAAMSHVGERCSFDTFLDHHQLSDPALQDLARIVRGADTDRLDLTPPSVTPPSEGLVLGDVVAQHVEQFLARHDASAPS